MSDYYNIDIEGNSNTRQPKIREAEPVDEIPEGYEPLDLKANEPKPADNKAKLEEVMRVDDNVSQEKNRILGGEGENIGVDDVLNDFKQQVAEDSEKNREKVAELELEDAKKVIATRDLLFSRKEEVVDIPLKTSHFNNETGEIEDIIMIFKAKRLNESESSELISWELANTDMSKMTTEQREKAFSYRRKLLAKVIVEPSLTPKEWHEKVDSALQTKLFDQCQRVLLSTNDGDLYQDFLN